MRMSAPMLAPASKEAYLNIVKMQAAGTTKRRRRKHAYHHGDLRGALLEIAFAIATRDGVDAITLRAVAAGAGVSEAAPYHHFRDKRMLLAAAAGAGFEDLDARLVRALAAAPEHPAHKLAAFAGAYVAFALEEPGAYRLVIGAHVTELELAELPEAAIPGRRAKARVRALAQDLVTSLGAHANVDAETIFRMVWAQAHGMASLVLEKELDARGIHAPDARDAIGLAEDAVLGILSRYRPRS
jgi:AcrR family transcriptional regulator